MSAIFLWVILNVQLATATPRKKYFLCTYGRVFKMARSNDMCCKKWSLTEFIVAENKSVTKMYKWLKNVRYIRKESIRKLQELLGGNNERSDY
jgi:hypothetical protein